MSYRLVYTKQAHKDAKKLNKSGLKEKAIEDALEKKRKDEIGDLKYDDLKEYIFKTMIQMDNDEIRNAFQAFRKL